MPRPALLVLQSANRVRRRPPREPYRRRWFVLPSLAYGTGAGLWGWQSGMPFWKIMPGALMCGFAGGFFLSVAVHALRTGCMQRMSDFYRFSQRPATFVMDSLMVAAGVVFCAAWPIGYTLQELAK